jgi:[ribosomal protein S5]-alanine N-acetyltransferase
VNHAPTLLETPRLRGRPIAPEHHAGLLAILGDPRVGATMGGVARAVDIDAQIARAVAHWEEHGFGWYAFTDRETGTLVARGGPKIAHVGGHDEVEIGWTVAPERWGEGIATELGAASIAIAFGPLGLVDVVSFTLPENHASRRVMEKLAFAFERDVLHAGMPHVLYRRFSTSSARSTSSSDV